MILLADHYDPLVCRLEMNSPNATISSFLTLAQFLMLVRLGMRQDISTMQSHQTTIVKLEVGVKYTTTLHLNLTALGIVNLVDGKHYISLFASEWNAQDLLFTELRLFKLRGLQRERRCYWIMGQNTGLSKHNVFEVWVYVLICHRRYNSINACALAKMAGRDLLVI